MAKNRAHVWAWQVRMTSEVVAHARLFSDNVIRDSFASCGKLKAHTHSRPTTAGIDRPLNGLTTYSRTDAGLPNQGNSQGFNGN